MIELPTSLEAVICIALFVVPGYIALSVSNMLAPRFGTDSLQNILRCFAYSLVVCAMLSWLFAIINEHLNGVWFWCGCTAAVMLGGIIVGIAIGLIRKKNLFRRAMVKAGNNVNSTTSPWDFKFSQINDAKWIKATLNDGREIFGLYSNDSDASSVADVGAGIYLEKTYNESWQEIASTDGVFIPYSSISTVEFFNEEAGEENAAQSE